MERSLAAHTLSGIRGHAFEIHQQHCKTRRRQQTFSVRMVPYWNKLPEEIMTILLVEYSSRYWVRDGSPYTPKVPPNSSPPLSPEFASP